MTLTQLATDFYAAINRNDMASVAAFFAPDILRTEPPGFPTSGTYRGRDTVLAHIAHGRGTWAEGTCDPEGILTSGDKVVVLLHVHVRLHGASDWIDGRFADGLVVQGGLITQFHTFPTRPEALAWAGL